MNSIVMKFGGTSLEGATAFQNAARIVAERIERRPVVVVSAMARFTDALNQKPSEPLLAMAYRGLGIAYVYAGDAKRGVQYFKLYLPFCPDAERQQLDQTIARYGG